MTGQRFRATSVNRNRSGFGGRDFSIPEALSKRCRRCLRRAALKCSFDHQSCVVRLDRDTGLDNQVAGDRQSGFRVLGRIQETRFVVAPRGRCPPRLSQMRDSRAEDESVDKYSFVGSVVGWLLRRLTCSALSG